GTMTRARNVLALIVLNRLNTSPITSACARPPRLNSFDTRAFSCCCGKPRPQLTVVHVPISLNVDWLKSGLSGSNDATANAVFGCARAVRRLGGARCSVDAPLMPPPRDSRRRKPRISPSYSLLPTLVAGRLPLVFGFTAVPLALVSMRGFDRLPGMRWLTRG